MEHLKPNEQVTLRLQAEHSQFMRFNHAKVRQTGSVVDGEFMVTLMHDQRTSSYALPFTGAAETDQTQLRQALESLRQEVSQLPVDPFLVLPSGASYSRECYEGQLLPETAVAETLLPIVAGLDFAGIYAAGTLIRAYADSIGQRHWFSTNSFALDYSLFTAEGQAVKGTVAGRDWNPTLYAETIATSKAQLAQLAQPPKAIAKGQYRTYFAPMAVAELLGMLSWGAVSEASLQQGRSSLRDLQRGEKTLSSLFTLRENFQRGAVPRFNSLGEIAPIELPIIQAGKLVNTLVNSRTAKEYGCVANGANGSESLRSPEVDPGTIARPEILKALDTGLYLSNLHYLNWSDRPSGRITGMTRYACFWVEKGELIAPIENLRFDDTLYRFWGEHLIGLTDFREFVPEVGTYDHRELGGILTPGMLVEDFTYTL
jgi:predicted Zn-dependent protease